MVRYVEGNLLEADVEALVNTVNTVGVMGKGIALQFRQAFPENYNAYLRACRHGEVEPGRMFVFATGRLTNPRYIINFPTKRHWRGKSRLEDIDAGLRALVEVVRREGIRSIAVPPLGCGSGGLDWSVVRPRIEEAFAALPEVSVLVYAPVGAPEPERMRVATKPPAMTLVRAAVLGLLERGALPGSRMSMLEIQKQVYLLQSAGEPMKFRFEKGEFGPYAEPLHHVLQRMEGHYIRGYGDRSRGASVQVLPQGVEAATPVLQAHPETLERLERVSRLIEGFETPYGLELLATVHWLAQEEAAVRDDVTAAIRGVHACNAHKAATFRPEHIRIAWECLREQEWIQRRSRKPKRP
jgi:O-acetyl-ADP-ribose deacetylase (regulator of RNase III)